MLEDASRTEARIRNQDRIRVEDYLSLIAELRTIFGEVPDDTEAVYKDKDDILFSYTKNARGNNIETFKMGLKYGDQIAWVATLRLLPEAPTLMPPSPVIIYEGPEDLDNIFGPRVLENSQSNLRAGSSAEKVVEKLKKGLPLQLIEMIPLYR